LGIDRKIELGLTAALVIFGACQIVVTYINNSSASKQVDKIIVAANGIKDAASQIQQAAYNFSGAAVGINNAGWNAFGQLKLQEQQMEAARTSSDTEARRSLDTTIENFREEQRAWVGVCGMQVEQLEKGKPLKILFRFCNSGKTPAYKVSERVAATT
jgi:hypothetical protein